MTKKSKKNNESSSLLILLKKNHPIGAQIKDVATAIKQACPKIFKKSVPYPSVRLVRFTKDEISYEIFEGSSRGKTGPI